jgi:tetratricopeptide (TPR) repeat protein
VATHLLDALRAAQDDVDAAAIRSDAAQALRRAAQRAATVGAPEAAERAYITARDLTPDEDERTELTEMAAAIADGAGRYEQALALLEEAESVHRAAGRERQAARLAARIGYVLNRLARMEDAVAKMLPALDVLGRDQLDPDVAELWIELGHAYVRLSDIEQATAANELALQMTTDLQLIPLFVRALNTQQIHYHYRGRVLEARALLSATIELSERHGLLPELARAQNNLGSMLLQWDLPDAETHLEASLLAAQRRGDHYQESISASNLSSRYLFTGRWDEAERLLEEVLAGGLAGSSAAGFVHQNLAILSALRGRTEVAAEHLHGLATWSGSDDLDLRATQLAVGTVVDLACGRARDALGHAREMLPLAIEAVGAASDPVRLGWLDALLAGFEVGDLDAVRELLTLLQNSPPGRIPPYLRATLAYGRARLAAAEARHDEVEDDARAAVAQLRGLGYPYHLAVAESTLAGWLIDRGRRDEADELLEGAVTALRALRAAPALGRAEALLARPVDEAAVEV